MTGNIFNIQSYSVHDGPGIRTLVFMKGCPLTCVWCCNPESQSMIPQLRYIEFKCKQCGNCVNSCKKEAVKHIEGKISFDFVKCLKCTEKQCLNTCYFNALSTAGKSYDVESLYKIIAKDKDFYDNSGGGVTFSGGEPFAQPEFLIEILKKCKENGISTAVETCGYADEMMMKKAAEYIDYFLFDIKIVDPEKHKLYTGKDNTTIQKNLQMLSSLGKNITARIPLIPGITDEPENLNDIVNLCLKLGINIANFEIYHTLGVDKYEEFGKEYKYKQAIERENSYYYKLQKMFTDKGISCEII